MFTNKLAGNLTTVENKCSGYAKCRIETFVITY